MTCGLWGGCGGGDEWRERLARVLGSVQSSSHIRLRSLKGLCSPTLDLLELHVPYGFNGSGPLGSSPKSTKAANNESWQAECSSLLYGTLTGPPSDVFYYIFLTHRREIVATRVAELWPSERSYPTASDIIQCLHCPGHGCDGSGDYFRNTHEFKLPNRPT